MKLTRKQRIQARIRRIKTLPWQITTALSILLLLSACLISLIVPRSYSREATNKNKNQITLDFVGDVMLARNIKKLGETAGYEKLFANMTSFWSNADYVFANLESSVLKSDESDYEESDKAIHLWADYTGLEAAAAAGINVFGCANNHSFDYGEKALVELIDYFQGKKITYSGIGKTLKDAASYEIIECNGLKIAFLAITEVYYDYVSEMDTHGGVLTMAYTDYNMLVYQASHEADVTIVYIHWGEENETSANKQQVALGHQMIDAGADIVIGSHPHVIQEVEKYKNSIIFYSLGNFIFDQGNTYARDSVMVEYTTNKGGNGEFRLYPVRINDGIPSVTSNSFYKARINRELSQGLAQDSYYLDQNGFIVIPFDISLSK